MTHFNWWQQQNLMLNQVKRRQRDSLLFGETSAVPPVAWKVFKLVGVDGDQHQHGVGHNQPPEDLQQTPPQRVVHLGHDTANTNHHQAKQGPTRQVLC